MKVRIKILKGQQVLLNEETRFTGTVEQLMVFEMVFNKRVGLRMHTEIIGGESVDDPDLEKLMEE